MVPDAHRSYPSAFTPHHNTVEAIAVPQFGGATTNTVSGQHFGISRLPTPREMVAALDQFVIGQAHAKRVSDFGLLLRCWGLCQC